MMWLGRGYLDSRDSEARDRQTRRFRMWRPWMWGPLRHRWQVHYVDSHIGVLWGPADYFWKTKIDREIQADAVAAYREHKEKDHEQRDRPDSVPESD